MLPHLRERGAEVEEEARTDLTARADAEAKAMREILVAQRGRIEKEYGQGPDQLRLKLDVVVEDEIRQLQANRRHWAVRLDQLAGEIDSEPDRIRRTYDIKAARLEPVGLAYLWPVTG